jgi:hypothetical protein
MKDRQYNDQMILDKKTNNKLQNTTKKNKYIEQQWTGDEPHNKIM